MTRALLEAIFMLYVYKPHTRLKVNARQRPQGHQQFLTPAQLAKSLQVSNSFA